MSNLFNSMVRGFGGQIGRVAANSMINGVKTEKVIRKSASLTLWQGIKTILWSFPMMFLSILITLIIFNGDIKSPNFPMVVFLITSLFTFIIGYGYYVKNKESI